MVYENLESSENSENSESEKLPIFIACTLWHSTFCIFLRRKNCFFENFVSKVRKMKTSRPPKRKRRIILLRGNIKRKGGNENEYEMKKRPLTKDDIFSIWAIKTYNCCMYVIQLFFSHSNTVLLNIYSV